VGRSGYEFVFDAEIAAEVGELRSAAETLRTEFEEVAISALGADHAAWTQGGFDDVGLDAGLAQGMGADEAGDPGADDEDWDARGHGVWQHPIIFDWRRWRKRACSRLQLG